MTDFVLPAEADKCPECGATLYTNTDCSCGKCPAPLPDIPEDDMDIHDVARLAKGIDDMAKQHHFDQRRHLQRAWADPDGWELPEMLDDLMDVLMARQDPISLAAGEAIDRLLNRVWEMSAGDDNGSDCFKNTHPGKSWHTS